MTIAIVAITNPDDVIVCVSDRMISYGDIVPADDNAMVKAFRISEQWTCAWSANNVSLVLPIVEEARRKLDKKGIDWEGTQAAEEFAGAYSETFHREFVAQHLRRFGYTSIDQFRQEGRSDLGDHFAEMCVALGRFDLEASFLLFGHDKQKRGRLFQIDSPGRITDHNVLKFAVVGSGTYMAMASLRWPPPLKYLLEDTVYRLLEAKFSAETASGVGLSTTVILRNQNDRITMLRREEIEAVRKIWRKEVADVPSPAEAIEIIGKSRAVSEAMQEDHRE